MNTISISLLTVTITFGTTVETKKPNKYTKRNTSVVQKKKKMEASGGNTR